MIKKEKLVLEWNLDEAKNDGYLMTGSFPLSLGNNTEFQEIKDKRIPIVFILENNIGIISKGRDKYPGELNSITENSKFNSIFNNVKENNNLKNIQEYIGFSTFYHKSNIVKGNRNYFLIKTGVKINLYSTNHEYLYIIEIIEKNNNEWRQYQLKPQSVNEINIQEEQQLEKNLSLSYKQLIQKINSKVKNETITSTIKRYDRNLYVVAYTLKKANGICDLCNKPSPFKKENDKPYLEVHHIQPLSNNGKDNINNTVAVCPNCHRELHFGKNKENLKMYLIQKKST